MFEGWKARREVRRISRMTPQERLRHDVRQTHHQLLYAEMTLLNLARAEENPELRRWFEERTGRLTAMRLEFDAMGRRLSQLDAEASLWDGLIPRVPPI